jgi:hypothetical protein
MPSLPSLGALAIDALIVAAAAVGLFFFCSGLVVWLSIATGGRRGSPRRGDRERPWPSPPPVITGRVAGRLRLPATLDLDGYAPK